MTKIFKGKLRKGQEYLFFEHLNNRGVRYGDWKLVTLNERTLWELYNLKTDRTETKNVVTQNPVPLKKRSEIWNKWAAENNVLTKPITMNRKE